MTKKKSVNKYCNKEHIEECHSSNNRKVMEQFQEERLFLAASILVSMDNCIDYTIDYCNERKAFGKKIIDNQVIQFRLSELKTEVELLRSLIYRACEHFIQGEDVTLLASMAKLKSGRLIREVADTCVQYYGGMGFTWENQAAKLYRDGRLHSIGGGTDEIMLRIISKYLNTYSNGMLNL